VKALALLFASAVAAIGPLDGTLPGFSPHRQRTARPSFNYTTYGGCHNIIVFASTQAETEVLWLRLDLDRNALPSSSQALTRDLSKLVPPARVEVDVYSTADHFMPCSDVVTVKGSKLEAPVIWTARRGTVTVTAVPPTSEVAEYPVTVQITGAVFEGPDGQKISPPRALTISTRAGRLVGG